MGRTVSVGQVALEAANDSQGHGIGSVAREWYPAYARYLLAFVRAYEAERIARSMAPPHRSSG